MSPIRRFEVPKSDRADAIGVSGRTGPVDHHARGSVATVFVDWNRPRVPTRLTVRGPGQPPREVPTSASEGRVSGLIDLSAPGQWWYEFAAKDGFAGSASGVVVARSSVV